MTAGDALKTLRSMLALAGVERAESYRTHDMRRGHAEDLPLSGPVRCSVMFCLCGMFGFARRSFVDHLGCRRVAESSLSGVYGLAPVGDRLSGPGARE